MAVPAIHRDDDVLLWPSALFQLSLLLFSPLCAPAALYVHWKELSWQLRVNDIAFYNDCW